MLSADGSGAQSPSRRFGVMGSCGTFVTPPRLPAMQIRIARGLGPRAIRRTDMKFPY